MTPRQYDLECRRVEARDRAMAIRRAERKVIAAARATAKEIRKGSGDGQCDIILEDERRLVSAVRSLDKLRNREGGR